METLAVQQLLFQEKKIGAPLPKALKGSIIQNSTSQKRPSTIKQSLDTIFPEQAYENKDVQKAKEILGALANQFSPEQLQVIVTEIKFLTSSWLDDYEREIFNGQTLYELLHNKGGT